MFSYYGSKSKIAHLYPKPLFGKIIEPFAGSARYSTLYWENEVHLFDLSDYVVKVWRYLIDAVEADVRRLPDMPSKINIEQEYPGLSDAERYLIGFHLCRGKAKPRKTGHGQNSWNRDKQRIAESVHKFSHWQIYQRSYLDIPNFEATWFIDPPYQQTMAGPNKSDRYTHWNIDYSQLAEWVRSRKGQVIVCEGDGADWLPFQLLATVNTNTNNRQVKKNGEYIWTQLQTQPEKRHESK